MGDKDGVAVGGVGSHSVVVCTTEARINDCPTVMSQASVIGPDRLGVDVLVEDEAHLGNR
jgi:hypothetical protein